MLIYMKVVNGVKKLFGAPSGIPAESDTEVVYKDKNAQVITLAAKDVYLDDGKGGIVRLSDGKAVKVFVDRDLVIPAAGPTLPPQ